MDVRYKPEQWQEMKEGIDKITKEAIPKLKDINSMLEDIESAIRELDSDRSISFEHRSKDMKLNELLDDYTELGNYCTNVGETVARHFDKPFKEDMDRFAGKMRDLSIKNYKTENRIGSTTTTTIHPSAHQYGQSQTITTKKKEITVDDIFKDSIAFDKVLQAQYKEVKKQNPDAELNYEQYREFAPSMRGFNYETIEEEQQKLESWRDIIITASLTIAAFIVPPLGVPALVAYGGIQLKSSIEGKDWLTGRELSNAERIERGAFGALDMLPVVGLAAKSFRAMDNFISMSRLAKAQEAGVEFNPNKVANVVQSMQNSKNYLFANLRLKGLQAEKLGNDKMYAAGEKIAREIDKATAKVPIFRTNPDGTVENLKTNLEEWVHVHRTDSNAKIQSKIDTVKASLDEMKSSRGVGNSVNSLSDIPTVKSGNFEKWFNSLTYDELAVLWQNNRYRRKIERELRVPGGMHEWHLVARAPQFKQWGVTAEQIRELRTKISDVEFVNPEGIHGGYGSTTAHNELLRIIDSSKDYDMFVRRLNNWANYRLKGGIDALPEGLRLN